MHKALRSCAGTLPDRRCGPQVLELVPKSPAQAAKVIEVGDTLIAIDGVSVEGQKVVVAPSRNDLPLISLFTFHPINAPLFPSLV
jgi:hypothetical protein